MEEPILRQLLGKLCRSQARIIPSRRTTDPVILLDQGYGKAKLFGDYTQEVIEFHVVVKKIHRALATTGSKGLRVAFEA